jgi:hypothetical protein
LVPLREELTVLVDALLQAQLARQSDAPAEVLLELLTLAATLLTRGSAAPQVRLSFTERR